MSKLPFIARAPRSRTWLALLCFAGCGLSCGGSNNGLVGHMQRGGGRAARPAGCAIEVIEGAPTRPTGSLGGVVARCRGEDARDLPRCNRQLQDQACALGAEVIWQVSSSEIEDGVQLRATAGVYR